MKTSSVLVRDLHSMPRLEPPTPPSLRHLHITGACRASLFRPSSVRGIRSRFSSCWTFRPYAPTWRRQSRSSVLLPTEKRPPLKRSRRSSWCVFSLFFFRYIKTSLFCIFHLHAFISIYSTFLHFLFSRKFLILC